MPNLEVEVMLVNHPHLFVVEIESVLEAPEIGASMKCGKCKFQGKVARVGTPGRKQRGERPTAPGQKSMLDKE